MFWFLVTVFTGFPVNAESRGTNSQEEDIYIEINIEIKFSYKSQAEGQKKVFCFLFFCHEDDRDDDLIFL